MALFTAEEARSAFRERQPHLEYKRADLAIFGEQLASIEKTGQQHDVFLSYSHVDAEIVLGICYILRKKFGLTVYVDRDDATLSENDVEVAAQLRSRLHSCLSSFISLLIMIQDHTGCHGSWATLMGYEER